MRERWKRRRKIYTYIKTLQYIIKLQSHILNSQYNTYNNNTPQQCNTINQSNQWKNSEKRKTKVSTVQNPDATSVVRTDPGFFVYCYSIRTNVTYLTWTGLQACWSLVNFHTPLSSGTRRKRQRTGLHQPWFEGRSSSVQVPQYFTLVVLCVTEML